MEVITIDFDDVVAEYNGYQGADVFGDPIPGVAEGLKELRGMGFKVVLYTCRMITPAMLDYIKKHDLEFDGLNTTEFNPPNTSNKPRAEYYVDDHAIRFDKRNGGWPALIEQIKVIEKSRAKSEIQ